MTYGDLVHLMRVEAQRLSDENYHSAAILLHEGADALLSLANGARGKTVWEPGYMAPSDEHIKSDFEARMRVEVLAAKADGE